MPNLTIALIGYGKMGKAIEQIALERGHTIELKISSENRADLTSENLRQCDVAIEFTNPQSAPANIKACIDAGVPVICGSTGWLNEEDNIKKYCIDHNGALLYASNFSIGVNIFFELNKKLAALMTTQKDYAASIEEIHHTQKKDAPSGTALTLANQITDGRNDPPGKINITSKRIDPAPGTHHVRYASAIDDIEIIHTAHSREGFAKGSLLAAEFIAGKRGIFTMSDVLTGL